MLFLAPHPKWKFLVLLFLASLFIVISDEGQWLNDGNTVTAFCNEMTRYADWIDDLEAQVGIGGAQLQSTEERIAEELRAKIMEQNEELVKLRTEKNGYLVESYSQNNTVERLRLRLKQINKLSAP